MRIPFHRLLLVSLAVLLASCGKETTENPDPNNPDPNNPGGGGVQYVPAPRGATRPQAVPAAAVDCASGGGTLNGRALAPNGTTPVAGAFVYMAAGDCWAGTDKDGRFSAKGLPTTAGLVRMEKGVFRTESTAAPGTEVSLQVNPAQLKMAYVYGDFDSIQEVLQRLGFTPDELIAENLATANLSGYAALFLNCGMDGSYVDDPDTQAALRAYVQNGGVLYASDYAEAYVKALFPGKVNFPEDSHVGAVSEQVATVLDEGLKRALGKEQASINFDSPSWAIIDSVPAGTQVLVRGPVKTESGSTLPDRPYMVQFPEGQGRVTYTSFHNEAQATADMNVLLEQLLFQL